MKLNHFKLGLIITIIIFATATGFSYLIIDSLTENGQSNLVEPSGGSDAEIRTATGGEGEIPGGQNIGSIPFSLGIGLSVSLAAMAAWIGSSQVMGDAASIMLDKILGDMTLNDLEIVRHMMSSKEFTVPELSKKTPFSRQTVWRQIKKMKENGLVEETGEKKLPKSGRGKPSQVFRFIGPEM